MKKAYRIICAVLALAMLASLALTSCGGDDGTTAPPSGTPNTTAGRTILETQTFTDTKGE